MGTITIADLEVFYRVGVTEQERADPQRLLVTVQMQAEVASAVRSDRIEDTIDYFQVAQTLLEFGRERSWNLIEKVAADIAELVRATYRPQSVAVEVKKFAIPQARYVSVALRAEVKEPQS